MFNRKIQNVFLAYVKLKTKRKKKRSTVLSCLIFSVHEYNLCDEAFLE